MFHFTCIQRGPSPQRMKMFPFHITTPTSDLPPNSTWALLIRLFPTSPALRASVCSYSLLQFSSQLAELPKRAWSLKIQHLQSFAKFKSGQYRGTRLVVSLDDLKKFHPWRDPLPGVDEYSAPSVLPSSLVQISSSAFHFGLGDYTVTQRRARGEFRKLEREKVVGFLRECTTHRSAATQQKTHTVYTVRLSRRGRCRYENLRMSDDTPRIPIALSVMHVMAHVHDVESAVLAARCAKLLG